MDTAIAAAKDAFKIEWRYWSAQRSKNLYEVADAIREEHDTLVGIETKENGKPLHESDRDVTAAANKLEYYADAADKHHGETSPDKREILYMTT